MVDYNFTNLILSLFITIAIYTVPIIIYRYVIVCDTVEKKKAKIITIIYAIIAFFIMSILCLLLNGSVATGGGLFLWSFVNYRILVGGVGYSSYNDENQESNNDYDNEVLKKLISNLEQKNSETDSPKFPDGNLEPIDTNNVAYSDKSATDNTTAKTAQKAPTTTAKIMYCRKCGTKLPENSAFCLKCGTAVKKS